MTKRIAKELNKFKYKNQSVKFNLGVFALTIACSFLIVIATFTQLSFKHYIIPLDAFSYIGADFSNPAVTEHFTRYYRYIPQIPAILFIVTLLGRKFGIISVVLYILTGLFLAPVFALGGGWHYVFQYGFGYILAYIPAVFFTGSIIRNNLTFRNILQATIVGVLTIHIIGILYMLFVATLQKENFSLVLGWIIAQSGSKIFYDLFFGFIAMTIGKFIKKILWVAMD